MFPRSPDTGMQSAALSALRAMGVAVIPAAPCGVDDDIRAECMTLCLDCGACERNPESGVA